MPPSGDFTPEQEQRIASIVQEAIQHDRRRNPRLRLSAPPPIFSPPRGGPADSLLAHVDESWTPSPSSTLASHNDINPSAEHLLPRDSGSHGRENHIHYHYHSIELQDLELVKPRSDLVSAFASQQSLLYTADSPRSSGSFPTSNIDWRPPALDRALPPSKLRWSSQPGDLADLFAPSDTPYLLQPPKDPNLVSWCGPNDPDNPKNWAIKKKWTATILVSLFSFLSPLASSMIAPALDKLSQDIGITNEIETQICFSIYILGFAVGPLFLGPLSEVYGRFWVLHLSMLAFLAFNLGCGFAKNPEEMMICRFLSGVGGSAPMVIGGGVISDCWQPEQRGKAMGIYALAPLLGPAVGPIFAGFVVSATTWRWLFWATSIADAIVQFTGFFLLPESYAPTLLQKRAALLRRKTGNQNLYFDSDKTISKALKISLARPFRLLATQPIIQVIALYMAYVFGLFYLLLATFPRVWQGVYGESVQIGGLNYLSLGIGYFIGAQISASLNDQIYRRLKKKNSDKGLPEFRIPLMFIGSTLMPIGIFWYGWSAEVKVHWIVPNLGVAVFGIGSVMCLQCMQTYIIDSYTRFAASGLAAAVVLRSVAGFSFPLFSTYMYNALGLGWGSSVLGFAGVVIGIPAPFIFWFLGKRLRQNSQYAAG